ncbi:MAG: hypothetical protein IJT97_11360 [Bacteroidaceae bacterium]|nr:hypothetical protein [Bacteroidaceae bacterium]
MRGIPALSDVKSDEILAHILAPEEHPLPARLEAEFQRVVAAARLIDEYPDERHVVRLMQTKYSVSKTQLRRDIAHAKQLFKTEHTFDWDLSFAWMIKDQMELIRECKLKGDLKNWNAAKKVLREMIGEKPAVAEDPRRMEKNVFYIQINNGAGQSINIPLEKLRGLDASDLQQVQDALLQPIESDAQAEEIFNS